MAAASGPNLVTSGLVFDYDSANTSKSWVGKPTTNYAYDQNPRIDTTYSNYSATASGTWNTKHPDAIRVYNDAGSEITGYVNTGVTDWTNTYHATWAYDPELDRPVVIMRDLDGNWKAKSWGLGQTYTSMGLSAGSTYTISWLSWTTDITKCANAGIYSPNASNSYNFWDGQSNSYSTAFNTVPFTWQRVYATFTVSSGLNYTGGLSVYMYGHYGNRGTVKIADVQIETGTPSGFSKLQTRSNTQSIRDLTGLNTITANSLTYASDGTFSFNGSSDYLSITNTTLGNGNLPWTVSCWMKTTTSVNSLGLGSILSNSSGGPVYSMMGVNNGKIVYWTYQSSAWAQKLGTGKTVNDGTWHMLTWVNYSNSTMDMYVDGVFDSNVPNSTSGNNNPVDRIGGSWTGYFPGSINSLQIYNVSLTSGQITQNFNASRGRYGI